MLSKSREINKEVKKRSKALNKTRSKVRNFDICTDVESASEIDITGPSRCVSNFDVKSAPLPCCGRHALLCDQAKVVRGEACRRIDDLLVEWKNYKKRAEEELRERFCIEQKLRQSMCNKDKEIEDLSCDVSQMRNCIEEQKQLIDQLNEELEEASCRTSRYIELQEQTENLINCVEDLKSEIQHRDEKIFNLEQERDSLTCLNSELCEKNFQLEGTIAEWKDDVNATRAELEILDDLVHSFDYKHDNAALRKAICGKCTLPPSSCQCSKLQPMVGLCKKKAPKCRPTSACKRSCNVASGSLCKKTACPPKKSALCALRALQRQHSARCKGGS